MHSRLKEKIFHEEISCEDNSQRSATLHTTDNEKDCKTEFGSEALDICAPDVFPLSRNGSPSYSISDNGFSVNDFEIDYPFISSSSTTNSNRLQQEYNISINSAESKTHFKKLRCRNPRNSTQMDSSKFSHFPSDSIEDISRVTADSEVKENVNSDTLIGNDLHDAYPFVSHQISNIYSSTLNATPYQFNFETTSPKHLPLLTAERNLNDSHLRRQNVLNEKTDQSFSKYITATDFKSLSTDTDKSCRNGGSTFIEQNEKYEHRNPNVLENSLKSEYDKYQVKMEYPIENTLQTKQNINLNCSVSSNCDSLLAQFDSSDEQLDGLRKEFGLESISEKDIDDGEVYDNIYEELSSILNDDFLPEETENSSSSPTPETSKKIRKSPVSTYQMKMSTECENHPIEKSSTAISNTMKGLSFSVHALSTKSYVPHKETDYRSRNTCFVSDIQREKPSNICTVSNTIENLSFLAGSHPGNDYVHHTGRDNKCKNTCFSKTIEYGKANESEFYNTVEDSLFSNSSYTKKYDTESAASDSICRSLQFSKPTAYEDRFSRDGTSNTVKSYLFPTVSKVEKHALETASEASRKRVHFSSDILHENAPNDFDGASSSLRYCKHSKFDYSVDEIEANVADKIPFGNTSKDMCCEDLTFARNKTTLFENNNRPTDVSNEKVLKIPEESNAPFSHLMENQNLLIKQENLNTRKFRHEASYDLKHTICQGENKSWGNFGRNLNGIVPFSSDILSKKNTLRRDFNGSTTCDTSLKNLKSNFREKKQTLIEPKEKLSSSCTSSHTQNLQPVGHSTMNIHTEDPRVASCVKVKIEPISDSFEMADLSFPASRYNNGLNSDIQNVCNIPINMPIKREDVRVKQENVSDESEFLKPVEPFVHSHIFHTSEINSVRSDSIANSQNCVYENMETIDSSRTKINSFSSSKEVSSRDLSSNSNEKKSMNKTRSIPNNVISPLQLKELYDVDKNVAKAVLKAINDTGMKNGLSQTQILKHIKQHKNVRLHAKLNQDVSRFLKSASEVGIIEKNGLKYSLSDKVKCIASVNNKSKKPPPKTQNKSADVIAQTPVPRQMETVKRNSQKLVHSPKLLGSKVTPSNVPTLKVFKTLRSRVVFSKSN